MRRKFEFDWEESAFLSPGRPVCRVNSAKSVFLVVKPCLANLSLVKNHKNDENIHIHTRVYRCVRIYQDVYKHSIEGKSCVAARAVSQ